MKKRFQPRWRVYNKILPYSDIRDLIRVSYLPPENDALYCLNESKVKRALWRPINTKGGPLFRTSSKRRWARSWTSLTWLVRRSRGEEVVCPMI